MPHAYSEIFSAVQAASTELADADPGIVQDASSLADLAGRLGLGEHLDTISHLYPETQDVILQAIKVASAANRPVYLTWRHSAIQRLEITVPSSMVSGGPMHISIHSRYNDDGLGPQTA